MMQESPALSVIVVTPVMLPPLIPILVSAAAGEVLGFSIGEGRAPQKQLSFELDRLRHITDRDRRTI